MLTGSKRRKYLNSSGEIKQGFLKEVLTGKIKIKARNKGRR